MVIRPKRSVDKTARVNPRSLPVHEWPDADRRAWEDACRPGARLKPGGSASYLAPGSREDFARRYGAFLGFLQRTGRLGRASGAAAQVNLSNVEAYIADLKARVRSVTVWNCIYKLRRAARLLAPAIDFSWLAEIEKDIALVMEPRSKLDRLVFTERLVEAGLTLIAEFAWVCHQRSHPRARCAERPHDRTTRALPCPVNELCNAGDWADVQPGSRQMVDHLATHQHEISQGG